MKVTTKFNIGDVVQHVYNSNSSPSKYGLKITFRVLEIKALICYGGTQVVYILRPLLNNTEHIMKEVGGRNREAVEYTEPELEVGRDA